VTAKNAKQAKRENTIIRTHNYHILHYLPLYSPTFLEMNTQNLREILFEKNLEKNTEKEAKNSYLFIIILYENPS